MSLPGQTSRAVLASQKQCHCSPRNHVKQVTTRQRPSYPEPQGWGVDSTLPLPDHHYSPSTGNLPKYSYASSWARSQIAFHISAMSTFVQRTATFHTSYLPSLVLPYKDRGKNSQWCAKMKKRILGKYPLHWYNIASTAKVRERTNSSINSASLVSGTDHFTFSRESMPEEHTFQFNLTGTEFKIIMQSSPLSALSWHSILDL